MKIDANRCSVSGLSIVPEHGWRANLTRLLCQHSLIFHGYDGCSRESSQFTCLESVTLPGARLDRASLFSWCTVCAYCSLLCRLEFS